MAERAPLLVARDVEACASTARADATTSAEERSNGDDGVGGWFFASDARSGRSSASRGVRAVAVSVFALAVACVACASAGARVTGGDLVDAARAGLGSKRRPAVEEGSTKNCANARADNAAGTFQVETKKCKDASLPGCVGRRSMCRFCQTHMATNRNHDWPICPQTVCDENEAFGCKMAGKKMSKKELAWAILRQHVREHNKMVDGVKIGKCVGNAQDHQIGRYQYSDSQCKNSGLPGCLGVDSECRFCNTKNAKKGTDAWPTCPTVVCHKHKLKSKYCEQLSQYNVPPEDPPKDWDEKSLPKSLQIADDDDDDDEDDDDDDDAIVKESHKQHSHSHSLSGHSKHHSKKHAAADDSSVKNKHSSKSDGSSLGSDDGDDDDSYYDKKDKVTVTGDDSVKGEDEDEDDDGGHVDDTAADGKHHHSKVKLGVDEEVDARSSTEETANQLTSTKLASELDSAVFSSFGNE